MLRYYCLAIYNVLAFDFNFLGSIYNNVNKWSYNYYVYDYDNNNNNFL